MVSVAILILLSIGFPEPGPTSTTSTSTTIAAYSEMVAITGGTYTQTDGTHSFSHTISNFLLGKYEVTYELWYKVY